MVITNEAAGQAPNSQMVLVVEDEPLIRLVTAEMLRDAGIAVIEAASPDEARDALAAVEVDLVFTDLHMPQAEDGLLLQPFPGIPLVRAGLRCQLRGGQRTALGERNIIAKLLAEVDGKDVDSGHRGLEQTAKECLRRSEFLGLQHHGPPIEAQRV